MSTMASKGTNTLNSLWTPRNTNGWGNYHREDEETILNKAEQYRTRHFVSKKHEQLVKKLLKTYEEAKLLQNSLIQNHTTSTRQIRLEFRKFGENIDQLEQLEQQIQQEITEARGNTPRITQTQNTTTIIL